MDQSIELFYIGKLSLAEALPVFKILVLVRKKNVKVQREEEKEKY